MHPTPPPGKSTVRRWLLPTTIGLIVLFAVCMGVAVFASSGQSPHVTAAAPSATGKPRPAGAIGHVATSSTPASTPASTSRPKPTVTATPPPKPKPAPKVTPKPTHKSTPKPAPKPATCGAPSNPWGFNLCGNGHHVTGSDLPGSVCGYFSCINNFSNGHGYMVECKDGDYSMSGGISGACSYHHGEDKPVYDPR
jgi:hypothetical protein